MEQWGPRARLRGGYARPCAGRHPSHDTTPHPGETGGGWASACFVLRRSTKHPPDLPHRLLDVVCSQLAILAHPVPRLLQGAAEAVKHSRGAHRGAAAPLPPLPGGELLPAQLLPLGRRRAGCWPQRRCWADCRAAGCCWGRPKLLPGGAGPGPRLLQRQSARHACCSMDVPPESRKARPSCKCALSRLVFGRSGLFRGAEKLCRQCWVRQL
jgi:hypothetical protein